MILLVNGPNLNLLGEREPQVYGHHTLADVERIVRETCAAEGVEVLAFQSNWEGALIDFLQAHRREAQGVILNPGALTHTSRALPDCLRALACPTIEVHLSNIHAREPWRRESLVAPAAAGQIVGLGVAGYRYAAQELCARLAAARGQADPAALPSVRSRAEPERWQAAAGAQVVAPPLAPASPPTPASPSASIHGSAEASEPAESQPGSQPPPQPMMRGAAPRPTVSPFALTAPEPARLVPGPDEQRGEDLADELDFGVASERGEYEPL